MEASHQTRIDRPVGWFWAAIGVLGLLQAIMLSLANLGYWTFLVLLALQALWWPVVFSAQARCGEQARWLWLTVPLGIGIPIGLLWALSVLFVLWRCGQGPCF